MTAQSKATIKSYFETGDIPTQGQFADLVDSYLDVSAAIPQGTVVSAGLVMPDIFAVAGSPITVQGNFVVTLSARAEKLVFASPASATGTPAFRSLLISDLPVTTVSAGSYTTANITVNSQGQITTAANGTSGSTTTIFNSTAQTITDNTQLTIAHGLGQEPSLVQIILQCITTDLGYAVGARVFVPGQIDDSGTANGCTVQADATNVFVLQATNYLISSKTTPGTVSNITNAKWQLYVRAIKFS